jgi:ABC-2 type transport system permease protein
MLGFWKIVIHEWRVLGRESATWAALLLLSLCVFYGAANGAAWTRAQAGTVAEGQRLDRAMMNKLQQMARTAERTGKDSGAYPPERSPGHISSNESYKRFVALPPAPLGALSIGQSDVNPFYFGINISRRDSFLDEEELENPMNLLAGRFDLAFVLVFIVPLVTMALCYNLLSGEHESGTLRLLLAQGVAPRTLLGAKLLARLLLLWAATLGFSFLALWFCGGWQSGPNGWLWAGMTMSFIAFWVALAGALSALGQSSASNALACGGAYLLLVLLLPSVVNLWASSRYPVPSRIEMMQVAREVDTEVRPRTDALIQAYYREHPGSKPRDFDPEKLNVPLQHTARQREGERLMAPHLARYERALNAQQDAVNRGRFLSPAVIAQEAFNDLSGSGLARHRRFMEAVSRYHTEYRAYFEPRTFRQVKLASTDYDTMPRFKWSEESARAIASRVLPGIGALILGSLTLLSLGLMFARRGALNF